jgi:hypothetical protein
MSKHPKYKLDAEHIDDETNPHYSVIDRSTGKEVYKSSSEKDCRDWINDHGEQVATWDIFEEMHKKANWRVFFHNTQGKNQTVDSYNLPKTKKGLKASGYTIDKIERI